MLRDFTNGVVLGLCCAEALLLTDTLRAWSAYRRQSPGRRGHAVVLRSGRPAVRNCKHRCGGDEPAVAGRSLHCSVPARRLFVRLTPRHRIVLVKFLRLVGRALVVVLRVAPVGWLCSLAGCRFWFVRHHVSPRLGQREPAQAAFVPHRLSSISCLFPAAETGGSVRSIRHVQNARAGLWRG
jgi:hypothetical protein